MVIFVVPVLLCLSIPHQICSKIFKWCSNYFVYLELISVLLRLKCLTWELVNILTRFQMYHGNDHRCCVLRWDVYFQKWKYALTILLTKMMQYLCIIKTIIVWEETLLLKEWNIFISCQQNISLLFCPLVNLTPLLKGWMTWFITKL